MAEKYTIFYMDDEEENLNLFYNSFKRRYPILRPLGRGSSADVQG